MNEAIPFLGEVITVSGECAASTARFDPDYLQKPVPDPDDPRNWPLRDRPLIYVAGYFSANPMHGTANAMLAFKTLLAAGWLPYVPHASIVLDMLSPAPPEFWYEYDLGVLQRCDFMYVCPDEATKHSTGVTDEILFCTKNDIPILYKIVDAKDRYKK